MPSDPVMNLHAQGLSAREIGERTGKTRNAVLGYIWRFRRRNVTNGEIANSMERHNGNLTAVAREVGLGCSAIYRRGFRGKNQRGPNRAIDLDTRSLIDEIEASGLSDRFITIEVEMGFNTIRHWRNGDHVASSFLAQCVRTVINRAI